MLTPALYAELARGLAGTAHHLAHLAAVWGELERRGEDLSDLRKGVGEWVPLIAAGRLAAEAVVAFAGQKMLLRAIDGVPLEQQRRLAAGDPVEVAIPGEPRRVERVPASRIPAGQLRAVFADGAVLPPAEQRLRLAARPRRKPPGEGAGHRYRPHYDPEAGTVRVGKMTVHLADLLRELAAAAGPDHPPADIPGEFVAVKTRLSDEESKRLLAACRRAGLPEWEMIRKAMRAFGLI